MLVEINNKTNEGYPEDIVRKSILKAIKYSGRKIPDIGKVAVSVAIVSSEEMKKINLDCRKKDEPTDVLSFPFDEKTESIQGYEEEKFLGEIIICPGYIKDSAKANGTDYEYEISYVCAHGALHLLGMKHGKGMFSLQEKIAGEITK